MGAAAAASALAKPRVDRRKLSMVSEEEAMVNDTFDLSSGIIDRSDHCELIQHSSFSQLQ